MSLSYPLKEQWVHNRIHCGLRFIAETNFSLKLWVSLTEIIGDKDLNRHGDNEELPLCSKCYTLQKVALIPPRAESTHDPSPTEIMEWTGPELGSSSSFDLKSDIDWGNFPLAWLPSCYCWSSSCIIPTPTQEESPISRSVFTLLIQSAENQEYWKSNGAENL